MDQTGTLAIGARIVVDSQVLAGQPIVRGTRLAVAFIIDLLTQGWSEADILRSYPILTADDIQACRQFSSVPPAKFTALIPLLHVSDSAAAEDFYCRRLGFQRHLAYRPDPALADPCYLGLARDGLRLDLSSFSGDGVPGGVVGITVSDVDALYAEFTAQQVSVALPPTDQTWGQREMYVKDADGNSLRFIAPLPPAPAA